MQILSPRLLLREPRLSDATAIFHGYAQDEQVTRYLVWRPHQTLEQTQEFMAYCCQTWASGKSKPYILCLRDDAHTALGMLDARIQTHGIELGYVLARAHWGNALMSEAVQALTSTALADSACYRVQAACDLDNSASARVLKKSGFVREAKLARYLLHPNISAEPRACWMYAKCK